MPARYSCLKPFQSQPNLPKSFRGINPKSTTIAPYPQVHALAETSHPDGHRARNTTGSSNTLGLSSRESIRGTADHADTGAILANCALTGGRTVATGDRLFGNGRCLDGRCLDGRRLDGRLATSRWVSSFAVVSRRLAARDGRSLTFAVVRDGDFLEGGVGLLLGGVDGEDHAGATVVACLAVEPWVC